MKRKYYRQRRARAAWLARRAQHPHYWTPEEDRLAREMRERGKSYGQISLRLKTRTPDAVYTRLRDYPEASR